MQLDYMREFVVFAHHLNMTRAASQLHMAQSNLSKHMKQLETEAGCQLIQQHGGKMYLTEAGSFFLSQVSAILDRYDRLAKECQALDVAVLPEAIVQTPSLSDNAAEEYYRLVQELKHSISGLQVRYQRVSHKSLFNSLKQGRLDLLLEYRCGSIDDISADYAKRKLVSRHISSDAMIVWCGRNHRFGRIRQRLSPCDLKDVPIMTPSDVSAPMRAATVDFCRQHGFDPLFMPVSSSTQEDFHDSCLPGSVYLYPASFADSPVFRAREDMVALKIEDSLVHAFAITRADDGDVARVLQSPPSGK